MFEDIVVSPKRSTDADSRAKRQPRYNVILMLKELFGHNIERGFQIATKVDADGRAVCLTTTLEHAELKRDQIHAYGKDEFIKNCQGSMTATLEPVE